MERKGNYETERINSGSNEDNQKSSEACGIKVTDKISANVLANVIERYKSATNITKEDVELSIENGFKMVAAIEGLNVAFKRGPGRPRKIKPISTVMLEKKRGPGRPRKVVQMSTEQKRGPGRPRKNQNVVNGQ